MTLPADFRPVEAKFALGRLVATPNALNHVPTDEILAALLRHAQGDWGELDPDDRASNDRALETGERLLSQYLSRKKEKFWIITECDRSATTILLPEDY